MKNNCIFLAIIPARGGSKGIKDKNIKDLKNKPLISYSIEAAKKSDIFYDIIVSTDSNNIATISTHYGAEVPFIRPSELSTDSASSIDVILHAIESMESMGKRYDYFMLLQPTSPLRTAEDIISAVELLQNKNANAIVSVCEVDHHPFLTNSLPADLNMEKFISEKYKDKRRQDFEKYYRLNGAIYIADIEYFKEAKDWYSSKTYAYIMPKERSIDIDTMFDLKFAELLLSQM